MTQTRIDGTENSLSNANNSLTYGVLLDWTVFWWTANVCSKEQLRELQKLGDAELKLAILN
jgi:hypothetical protein